MAIKKTSPRQKIILILSVMAANIFLDQIGKLIAKYALEDRGDINVIGKFFILMLRQNRGAFLGMGDSLPNTLRVLLLIIIPTILLVLLLIYVLRHPKLQTFEIVCFSTIMGGGFSNLADRYIYNGYVTDFLHFNFGLFRTGVLNFSDMSITFGAIALLIYYIVKEMKIKKQTSSSGPEQKETGKDG